MLVVHSIIQICKGFRIQSLMNLKYIHFCMTHIKLHWYKHHIHEDKVSIMKMPHPKKIFHPSNEIYSNPIISIATRYNAKSRCAAHLIACITLDTSCSISTNRTICNTIQTLLFLKRLIKKINKKIIYSS